MIIFLAVVGGVGYLIWPQLQSAFASNPVLNGVIAGVAVLGVLYNLRQVAVLDPEVRWLEAFRAPRLGAPAQDAPRLLSPMAAMLAQRRGERLSLSASSMRSVLDGIASRLDESRELSRYMTALLIFLGLLGTFWGLLETIASVSQVIGDMSVGGGDVAQLFNQLKTGLAEPLRGMGTAFSASMLGLAGSLVLGFLDLTAGQAQNRFFNELEEWLAGQTRLSSGLLGAEDGSVPAYVQALLEQNAENLEQLQRILARGEENRQQTTQQTQQLAERLNLLAEQMRQSLAVIQHSAEEASTGRVQAVQEIRSEIKVLTRTLAGLNDNRR
jgi:biopolymer transport protein ExbB/TolQ